MLQLRQIRAHGQGLLEQGRRQGRLRPTDSDLKGRRGNWKGKKGNSAHLSTNDSPDDSGSQNAFVAFQSDTPHFDSRLSRNVWLTDSGCTVHITNKRDMFTEYTPLTGEAIGGLGDNIVRARGRGIVTLESIVDIMVKRRRLPST